MSFWKGKKVLVTGAGGFIGSYLTEELVNLEADVTCFVKYNSRNDWGLIDSLSNEIKKEIRIITGDLKDSDAVAKAVRKNKIIFHLGALIAIPYSYIHPRDTIETNILGILNILTSALQNKVEKVIHTSTSEVYGTACYIPIDEKHPLQAQSPYSASKIAADKIAESYYLSYNLPINIIRPFNTYGPRQSARSIIPTIITQALNKDEIHIGSLYPKRDFTFVTDTVAGFIKIAEVSESIGEAINIGSGFEISIAALVNKILSLMGKKKRVISDPKRERPLKSEVGRLLADNSKAKNLLGWTPKISFDDGLKQTINYIKDNIGIYKSDLYNI